MNTVAQQQLLTRPIASCSRVKSHRIQSEIRTRNDQGVHEVLLWEMLVSAPVITDLFSIP